MDETTTKGIEAEFSVRTADPSNQRVKIIQVNVYHEVSDTALGQYVNELFESGVDVVQLVNQGER